MPPGRPGVKCHAKSRRSGKQCGRWAAPGGTTCIIHGARTPVVAAKNAVRAELLSWDLNDTTEDPGEVLLRLVTQSARRVRQYSTELASIVEQAGSLEEALIGDSLVLNREGDEVKVGEYIRGLAQLEATERDRCANFSAKAVAAGLATRAVELAERQGELIADVLRIALADPSLGLTPEQLRQVPDVAQRALASVAS